MIDRWMLIGGEWCIVCDGCIFDCFNFVMGVFVLCVLVVGSVDVDVVIDVVYCVFFVWVVFVLIECCWLLLKVVDLMDVCIDEIIVIGVVEMGVMFGWIGFNVMFVVNMLCEVVLMMM